MPWPVLQRVCPIDLRIVLNRASPFGFEQMFHGEFLVGKEMPAIRKGLASGERPIPKEATPFSVPLRSLGQGAVSRALGAAKIQGLRSW